MESTIIFKRPVSGLSQRALTQFVVQACRAAGLKGSVTVMVTHSREMRSLNARFRGKNYPTDDLGEMAEKEQRLRRRFRLPTGLTERVHSRRQPKGASPARPARSRT